MCWFFKPQRPKNNQNNPLIFIPGIMGSYSPEIIGLNGGWSFGIAAFIYRPFINNLKRLGYIPGKNLFICYYNWTKSNIDSAKDFLIPVIQQALDKNPGAQKVDLVCHSMGGIVARCYMQSDGYRQDVDRVVFMATPHLGAINAYYPWSGGTIAPEQGFVSLINTAAMKGFLWILRKRTGESTNIDVVRKYITSVGELLPSQQFGDYIYYRCQQGKGIFNRWDKKFIPISDMEAKNPLLNRLNAGYMAHNLRNIAFYNIIGQGHPTNRYLEIEEPKNNQCNWLDGKPLLQIKSDTGDGTVLSMSASHMSAKCYYNNGSHTGVLKEAIQSLVEALSIDYRHTDVLKLEEFVEATDYLSIIVDGQYSLKLTSPYRQNLLYNNISNNIQNNLKDALIVPLSKDLTWIFAPNPEQGEYRLEVDNITRHRGRIFIDTFQEEGRELYCDGAYRMEANVYTINIGGAQGVEVNQLV